MDIQKINSITKYPSILTYHAMGERGKLKEELSEQKQFPQDEELYCYEKVDGENTRIIFINSEHGVDYFIGSREEMLTAMGDRVVNPHGNIATFLVPLAESLKDKIFKGKENIALTVIYQESYGGSTPKSRNYTSNKQQGYRVFDVFSLTHAELKELLNKGVSEIASWRDNGGQPFYNETNRTDFVKKHNLLCSPKLDVIKSSEFPKDTTSIYEYLKNFEKTQVGINAEGKSEGIIVRTKDREMIRKIRFQDYERTLNIR